MAVYPLRCLNTRIGLAVHIQQGQPLKHGTYQHQQDSEIGKSRQNFFCVPLPLFCLCQAHAGHQKSCSHQGQEGINRQHIAHKLYIEITRYPRVNQHPGQHDQPQISIALPDAPQEPQQPRKCRYPQCHSHTP